MKATRGRNKHMRKTVWRVKYDNAPVVPCCHCKADLVPSEFTLEHLVPISLGGANTVANCDIACQPCNAARGNSMAWVYGDRPALPVDAKKSMATSWFDGVATLLNDLMATEISV